MRDLGFTKNPTTTALFKRTQELGLELCPPETGPYMRLANKNQPLGDWYRIGMKQISDSGGIPDVFSLGLDGGELWLHSDYAHPDNQWFLGDAFVFRRCKSGT